jgi:hypothetical protein
MHADLHSHSHWSSWLRGRSNWPVGAMLEGRENGLPKKQETVEVGKMSQSAAGTANTVDVYCVHQVVSPVNFEPLARLGPSTVCEGGWGVARR